MQGIMFKPDMIKAIAEGRKTQTRRLGGLEVINQEPDKWVYESDYGWFRSYYSSGYSAFTLVIKPRYKVGEVVYIKEAFWEDSGDIYYKSDCPTLPTNMYFEHGKWKSPLFLKEIFARYFIQITAIRPERLNQITEEDILKEGCPQIPASCGLRTQWYKTLWDSINKNQKWETNPFCWVYNFKLVKEEK